MHNWYDLIFAKELDRLKDVAEYEAKQDQCGSYLCMLPCDGDKTVFTLFET